MAKQSRSSAYADASIRHQVLLQRYNNGVVRRMLALLARTDADIVGRLQLLGGTTVTASSLEANLAQVRVLSDRLTANLKGALLGEIGELSAAEAEFAAGVGNTAFGVQFAGPTLEQVRAAALARPFQGVHLAWALAGEHIDELGRRRAALVRDTIRRGFLEGDGVDELVRRLRGSRNLQYRDGLLETSRRTTEAVVRTALNHTANAAREEVYALNARLIASVRWTAVLDGRTSAVCRGRDGNLYPLGEGPRPPAHPNCRSTTVPVFKGDPPPNIEPYGTWLKRQPTEFIEEVLGKSKAKLFLDGNLPLDRFIDNKGEEYSLAELRVRDAKAFRAAGL